MSRSGRLVRVFGRPGSIVLALALCSGALPLLSAGPADSVTDSVTLKAVADTTVVEGKRSSLGSSRTLLADGDPQSEAYLRFTLGSIDPAAVSLAELRVWATDGAVDGPSLHPVTGSWSESTTFVDRPSVGVAVADLGKVKKNSWQVLDVTSLARDGITDFALVGTAPDGADFTSRQGTSSHRPQLIIETAPSSPPTPPTGGTGPSGDRPNVMIILTDDQRPDTLEVMPKTRDWLVKEGTSFPRGYVTTPLCCPSRSTLMSGRYMHNHTVYDNNQDEKLDKDWTLARYLQDAGYRTAMAGKYLVGHPRSTPPPNYDRFAITNGGYRDATFNVDGMTRKAPYSTDFIGEITNDFLDDFEEADDAQPWFVYVTPQAPHSDFEPSKQYEDAPVPEFVPSSAFSDNKSDKAPFLKNKKRTLAETVAEHDGQLRTLLSVDDMVDSIMTGLKARDELDNTLIIYSSDNGYHWGDFGVRGKGLPFTQSISVPYLRAVARPHRRRRCRQPDGRQRRFSSHRPRRRRHHPAETRLPARRPFDLQ